MTLSEQFRGVERLAKAILAAIMTLSMEDYLTYQLRRTTKVEEAVFTESRSKSARAIRCITKDAVNAAKASCRNRRWAPIADGTPDEKTNLGGLKFTWIDALGIWRFKGDFYSIDVMRECCRADAETWVKTFLLAEKQGPAFHRGKNVNHVLGTTGKDESHVAVADPDHMIVRWHTVKDECRLFSVALADATKESPCPIETKRMIHHEVAHLYEPEMSDWLVSLTAGIESIDLDKVAKTLNAAYLPARLEIWRDECQKIKKYRGFSAEKNRVLAQKNESLAAEFLVEFYAHRVIEGKPWPKNLWPVLDSLEGKMKSRVLSDYTAGQEARGIGPIRVWQAPRLITVKDSGKGKVSVSI
jgi:hypothetical protein